MKKSEEFLARRQNIVPRGVGIFNPATAVSAKNGTIISADGEELIDFVGGIGVLNIGHCPDSVVEAICKQAQTLIHTCFHIATYEPYLELCEKLAELFPHGEKTKVMLTNTGAESVENAIKIARQATGRSAIIAFTGAFHGRSMMAMSLTSKTAYKIGCGPFAPEVYRIPYPNFYKNNQGLEEDEFVARELYRFRKTLDQMVDVNQVAAVIIEPVQGEGGFVVCPKGYLQGLRKICDELGIMLIIDEVQSGFARTGAWAAYEHYGVTPDISTWAKSMGSGMPIGAVIGKAAIMDAAQPGTIGGTYLGNPVSCAASLATIKYMEENNLNQRGKEVGEKCMQAFLGLQEKYPEIVGDVRGLGAMVAFELVHEGDSTRPNTDLCLNLIKACAKRNLLIISAGTYKNVVRVLSPLTISDELLDKGLNILTEEFEKLVVSELTH